MNTILRRIPEMYQFDSSIGYNNWIQYIFNQISLDKNIYNNIFLILDGTELEIELDLNILSDIFKKISEIACNNEGIRFWISDIHMLDNDITDKTYFRKEEFKSKYLNVLADIVSSHSNVHIFPLNKMITQVGTNRFYSMKMWYLASLKYSAEGENIIIKKIKEILQYNSASRKKCLILDMDNTLWGGVIGEVGYQNIELSNFGKGARYKDFQKKLLEIKEKGVILTIVSKNNYEDAISSFQNKDMVLKQEDFVCIYANWNNKIENICKIADLLNIGLDSMVFVDDNPVEREMVKQTLSEVIIPEFPTDTALLSDFAIMLYENYFLNLSPTHEDSIKSLMYQDNLQREKIKGEINSIDEFIKRLGIKIRFKKPSMKELTRISELSYKTNQYNTTSIQYNENELKEILNNKSYRVYIASVSDNIGDNGLCIVCILKLIDNVATIENFFMSCRIMGKSIETAFLSHLLYKLKQEGIEELVGLYKPSGRNIPSEELFIKHNFIFSNEAESIKIYRRLLEDVTDISNNLIEVVEIDS
jgi:FkbH-like protein